MRSLSTIGLTPLEQVCLLAGAIQICIVIYALLQAHWAINEALARVERVVDKRGRRDSDDAPGSHEHTPIEHTTRTTTGD